VIGPTLVVRGEVTAQEDLLIRGRVEGTIEHNQVLTVHSEGIVHAVVRAKEIHIEGTVEGDLFGTERISVCVTGRVVGNVVAPRVAVLEGAHFKGMVDMDSDAAAIERRFQERTGNRSDKSTARDGSETKAKASGRFSGRNGNAVAAQQPVNAPEEKVNADAETPAADDQSSDAKAS
jgi:cytoskeletal protein CcmA (bactofilin family)